jgi:hypothetical protein
MIEDDPAEFFKNSPVKSPRQDKTAYFSFPPASILEENYSSVNQVIADIERL